MKVIGRLIDETSEEVGRKYFVDMYNMTPEVYIDRYELDEFTTEIEGVKAFVHLEYDGEIAHAILLEDGDKAVVKGGGCNGQPFNTDGMAFLEVAEKNKMLKRQFCYDNSPYQLTEDDDEWFEFFIDYEDIGHIQQHFVEDINTLFGTNLNFDEIIFVRML
jgi:hypothetical protein